MGEGHWEMFRYTERWVRGHAPPPTPQNDTIRFEQTCTSFAPTLPLLLHLPLEKQHCSLSLSRIPCLPFSLPQKVEQCNKTCRVVGEGCKSMQIDATCLVSLGFLPAVSSLFGVSPGTTRLGSRRPTSSPGLSVANRVTAGEGVDARGIVLHPPPIPAPNHPFPAFPRINLGTWEEVEGQGF